MDIASAVAAGGVWLAVPLTGYLACMRTARLEGASFVAGTALATAVGIAIWSVPLLGSVVLGVYRPAYIGVAGWVVALLGTVALWRRGGTLAPPARRGTLWDWVLVIGLLTAAGFYLGFPTESIYGGRDEGVYANHAIYMAHHGRLDVPYPWPRDADGIFVHAWIGFPGFYDTPGTMTVQFGHLFPVWLAQAYATFGQHGLFRLNAVFALLGLAIIYDVFALAAGPPIAVVATLFLAFNPSQLWIARITLSEILTQLFTWSGLCLLLRALKQDSPALARWAGVCFGMSAMVRFDSLLLLPMLLLARAGYRVVAEPPSRAHAVWTAMYTTSLPLFGLALAYFLVFSRPYLEERPYVRTLGVAIGLALFVMLMLQPVVVLRIRPWLRQRAVLALAGGGLVAFAAYAYWIRPLSVGPPQLLYQFPGFFIDTAKGDYRADSLVDLALYVSPAVVWAAIGGWYVSLRQLVSDRSDAPLGVLLVVIAGYSFAYLYNPANTPDHLWWIRRFTPVVIPGVILYAGVAARALFPLLPSRWSTVAAAGAVLLLIAFTARIDQLILTFAEDQGLYGQLNSLAQKLPAGAPIIAHGRKSWLTPLYLAFDRPVIPIDLTSADGQQAWHAWNARQTAANQPVYVLTEVDDQLQTPNDVSLSRRITGPTVDRLPDKAITLRTLYRIATLKTPGSVVLPPPDHEHTEYH